MSMDYEIHGRGLHYNNFYNVSGWISWDYKRPTVLRRKKPMTGRAVFPM
jgi:hypothetical protein